MMHQTILSGVTIIIYQFSSATEKINYENSAFAENILPYYN